MYEYINEPLMELPLDMNGAAKTPAAGHIFNIDPDAKKFPEDKAQLFNHLILYLCRCTLHDIQTYVRIPMH